MSEASIEGLTPPPDRRTEMVDHLIDLAMDHVSEPGSKLSILPRDMIQLDWHIHNSSPLVDSEKIEEIARSVDPRCEAIQARIDVLGEREFKMWRTVNQILRRGGNVLMVMNHGELPDTGYVEAADISWLNKSGNGDVLENSERAIFVSQITSAMGIEGVDLSALGLDLGGRALPLPAALAMPNHHVWKSWANTRSVSGIRQLFADETEKDNGHMRTAEKAEQDKGGQLIYMNPSGAKDRPIPGARDTHLLQPLTPGTIKIMTHPDTYVLPRAVWLEYGEPIIEHSGIGPDGEDEVCVPLALTNADEANAVMSGLSATLNRIVPERRFVYVPDKQLSKHSLREAVRRVRERY